MPLLCTKFSSDCTAVDGRITFVTVPGWTAKFCENRTPGTLTLPVVAVSPEIISVNSPVLIANINQKSVPVAEGSLTVTVTSSEPVKSESLAVRRNTYVPAWLKLAVVVAWLALPKVTSPGPLTLVHVDDTTTHAGSPSSVTVPLSVTDPVWTGIVWSEPALTIGATFWVLNEYWRWSISRPPTVFHTLIAETPSLL